MNTTMTTSTMTSSCKRYDSLLKVMEKAMTSSRESFDIPRIARDCYGEDIQILGNTETATLFASMLDRVHEQVQQGMIDSLKIHQVLELLQKVERSIQTLDRESQQQRLEDDQDKESAQDALRQVSLPKGVTPDDMVNLKAFERMQAEKEAILKEIAEIEKETVAMEEKHAKLTSNLDQTLQKVKAVGKKLDQSADLCSMVA